MSKDLLLTEELDFAYLLELMPPLEGVEEFALLPELFSIIGHEKLLLLCNYAGGETIRIPTLQELADSIEALQWFYDVHVVKKKDIQDVPENVVPLYIKICEVYFANGNKG